MGVAHELEALKPFKGSCDSRRRYKPTLLITSEHLHDLEVEKVRYMDVALSFCDAVTDAPIAGLWAEQKIHTRRSVENDHVPLRSRIISAEDSSGVSGSSRSSCANTSPKVGFANYCRTSARR